MHVLYSAKKTYKESKYVPNMYSQIVEAMRVFSGNSCTFATEVGCAIILIMMTLKQKCKSTSKVWGPL